MNWRAYLTLIFVAFLPGVAQASAVEGGPLTGLSGFKSSFRRNLRKRKKSDAEAIRRRELDEIDRGHELKILAEKIPNVPLFAVELQPEDNVQQSQQLQEAKTKTPWHRLRSFLWNNRRIIVAGVAVALLAIVGRKWFTRKTVKLEKTPEPSTGPPTITLSSVTPPVPEEPVPVEHNVPTPKTKNISFFDVLLHMFVTVPR